MSYAAGTGVPVERTRMEIEALLIKRGASQTMSAFDHGRCSAIIGWTTPEGRMIRIAIPLPSADEKRFNHRRTRTGFSWKTFPAERRRQLWEQACRSRWRAILLILKAKFEAIDAGISSLDREFLADVVMADGQTVGSWIAPQLDEMYSTARMPRLLPIEAGP